MYHSFNPIVDNNEDKYYPYECAFDFEAMLKTIKATEPRKEITNCIRACTSKCINIFKCSRL